MTSMYQTPQISHPQELTMDDVQNGGFDQRSLVDVDFDQFLNNSDFGDNSSTKPRTDTLIQNNNIVSSGLDEADITSKAFIAPNYDSSLESPASTTMPFEPGCSTPPGVFPSDCQLPAFEDGFTFSQPPTYNWTSNASMQSRFVPFRPTSAPPLGTYDSYPGLHLTPQVDRPLRPQEYQYPPPPDNIEDMSGMCLNTVGPYGLPPADLVAPTSQPYHQTSISYPGSPTQPFSPAPMAPGYFGQPGMLRQVRQYHPSPSSNTYGAPAMFSHGHSSVSRPMQQPIPTSNPYKYATAVSSVDDLPMPKRRHIEDWVADTNAAQPPSQCAKLHLHDLRTRSTAKPNKRSILESINSQSSEVDITTAVKLATRRTRNPGRKSTIPQTSAVLKRNRIRRERYRASLSPQKREAYDLNASIAKGLITIPAEESEEEDAIHDDVSDISDVSDGSY